MMENNVKKETPDDGINVIETTEEISDFNEGVVIKVEELHHSIEIDDDFIMEAESTIEDSPSCKSCENTRKNFGDSKIHVGKKPNTLENCRHKHLEEPPSLQKNSHDNYIKMDNKNTHFTEHEKILLATLVKEHPVLENKKTDGASIQLKQLEWENLAVEFNRQPEVITKRDSKQLKTLWKNLKQRKRKKTTFERYQALVTGGGIAEKAISDPLLDLMKKSGSSGDDERNSILTFENEDNDFNPVVNRTTPTATNRRCNKRKQLSKETNLRMKRISNQIAADKELNSLRISLAKEDLKRVQYQSELARLQLQKFKIDNNLL